MNRQVIYENLGSSLLVRALGNSPKMRIIDIFMTNLYFDFSREELVKELGMSKQTLCKNLRDLEELEIVKVSRKIGRATMYTINREHPLVKRLGDIVKEMSLQVAKQELERQSPQVAQVTAS
jgi:transcription initiation factor IIE alpha subunit